MNNLPWNLPEPKTVTVGSNLRFDPSYIESDKVLQTITIAQLEQYGDSAQAAWGTSPTSSVGVLNELKSNLSDKWPNATNTNLYILVIVSPENANAHAVLPYKIDSSQIYIYDPNDPAMDTTGLGNAYDDYVNINFDGSATLHSHGTNMIIDHLVLLSLKNVYNIDNLPSISATKIFMNGDASLLLIDPSGNLSGYFNGQVYNQIPGLAPFISVDAATNNASSSFQFPTGYTIDTNVPFKIVVQGTGNGPYNITTIRNNYLATISGSTAGTSSVDTFSFSSSSVQAAISPADAGKAFSVILDNTAGGQDHIFTATTTPTASSTYIYSVNWNALAQGQNGVTLQIDSGNSTPVHTVQVGASFGDNIPPVTTPTSSGTLGLHNWYISNTVISLNTIDNKGGVGVAAIKYSLDNSAWQTYATKTPITISAEGVHTLKYYSTDYFGNQEATGTLMIKIDKTAPEASVSVSTSTRSILVQGIDHIASTTVIKDLNGNYIITNDAGHTTKLVFNNSFSVVNKFLFLAGILQFAAPTVSIDLSGNYLINNNASQPVFASLFMPSIITYAQLLSIQYDSNPVIKLPVTHFFYVWNGVNKTLSNQTIFSVNNFFLQAFYSSKTNQTTAYSKLAGKAFCVKVFTGLEIPQLITSKGTAGFKF